MQDISKLSIPFTDYTWDIECYRDLFSAVITHAATRESFVFEVSDRRDDSSQFLRFLRGIGSRGARLFGFNNVAYDYPVVHHLLKLTSFTSTHAYEKSCAIIHGNDRFAHTVWPNERIITQGDLYLIHHFDNVAKRTSLKKLEIAMGSGKVIDLPYPPDKPTTSAQKSEIISYMRHDDYQTWEFYKHTLDAIKFRDDLAVKYPALGDVLNFNDTKIGTQFFIMRLEQARVPCYSREYGQRRQPRQTLRSVVDLGQCVSPRVSFQHPEFERVRSWLTRQRITETNGVFSDLSATIEDFRFDFGTGGLHGSLTGVSIRENEQYEIWDWDVASYYPNLAIKNNWYPEHLSNVFCDVNEELFQERKNYGKKTSENGMLKLALNGVYGNSNNVYSSFYDPQYTMKITINGQLMLCMLAEWFLFGRGVGRVSGVHMIQANTDGITVLVRKDRIDHMRTMATQWQKHTGLTLEDQRYAAMHIRDVNSYIAVKDDGSCKRIGAYAYVTAREEAWTREVQWHKDHSQLVVPKAAEAYLVRGVPIEEFVFGHALSLDFQKSVKVPRDSRLEWGDEIIQNTTRYYVSTVGKPLVKVMPPLAKAPDKERRIGIEAGYTVTPTNDMSCFDRATINWYYYINEVKKLTNMKEFEI